LAETTGVGDASGYEGNNVAASRAPGWLQRGFRRDAGTGDANACGEQQHVPGRSAVPFRQLADALEANDTPVGRPVLVLHFGCVGKWAVVTVTYPDLPGNLTYGGVLRRTGGRWLLASDTGGGMLLAAEYLQARTGLSPTDFTRLFHVAEHHGQLDLDRVRCKLRCAATT
jgi:hypothetical protein